MRSRRLGKMAALVLVLAVASGVGAFVAHAACTTQTYFAQGGNKVTAPIAPDSSGEIVLECLHDAFGNPTPGQTVNFTVTPPGGTATSAGSAVTDATGRAAVAYGATPGETSIYGSYGIKATQGTVISVTNTFDVGGGAPSGTFALTLVETAPNAGDQLHIEASGLQDGTAKPVSNGTVVTYTVTGPSGFAKSYTAQTAGVATSADVAKATVAIPGSDLTRAGSYTVKGKAGAAVANPDLVFSLAAGAVASISAGVSTPLVTVGNSYDVKALNGLDSYGNKAVGKSVVFNITDALSATTTIPANPGVDPAVTLDANGNATRSASAAAANQAYGVYSLVVTSGATSSAPVTYQVQPGLANTITSAVPSEVSVPAGTQVTLAVNGVKSNGYAAKSGTIVRLERDPANPGSGPAPMQKVISGVTKADDASGVSFDVPAEYQQIAGHYKYKVIADSAIAFIEFDVIPGTPVADLSVSALDTRQYSNAVVTVGNYGPITTNFRVHVTAPDGSTFDVAGTPSGGATTAITIPASNITKLGTYVVQVYAKDAANAIVGTGSGSFAVSTAIPDTITVTVSDELILPLQTETITARATMGTDPAVPTPGRALHYTVKNPLGQTAAAGTKIADADGKIVFAVFQTQTLLPGPYTITVTDDGGASGTASFTV